MQKQEKKHKITQKLSKLTKGPFFATRWCLLLDPPVTDPLLTSVPNLSTESSLVFFFFFLLAFLSRFSFRRFRSPKKNPFTFPASGGFKNFSQSKARNPKKLRHFRKNEQSRQPIGQFSEHCPKSKKAVPPPYTTPWLCHANTFRQRSISDTFQPANQKPVKYFRKMIF